MDSEDQSGKPQNKNVKKNVFKPYSKIIQRNKEQSLEFGEESRTKGGQQMCDKKADKFTEKGGSSNSAKLRIEAQNSSDMKLLRNPSDEYGDSIEVGLFSRNSELETTNHETPSPEEKLTKMKIDKLKMT